MAKRKAKDGSSQIESVRHKDKRKNIPTEELRDFVREEEQRPQTVLYPRDPSLDPQLVWKGKDEQDRQDLEVPAVPIYIQEKIHPQALIEDFRRSAAKAQAGDEQLDLFADFNGLDDFDKKVDFYHHDQHWSNRMILGDSLLVMTSLAEKEGLKGQVQTIYFDPPYGIKFGSNWQVSTRKRDVRDGKVDDVTRQPEQIRAFRDTWSLGIHSYLAYLRDRLVAARELLTDSGSVFVQIGDENVHLVRGVLDEVMGSDNFCSIISFATTTTTTGRLLPGTTAFLLWYAKDATRVKYRQLYHEKAVGGLGASSYSKVELRDGTRRPMSEEERANPERLPNGARPFRLDNLTSPRVREARTGYYPIELDGRSFLPRKGEWKTNSDGMDRLKSVSRLAATDGGLYYVRFIDDFPAYPLSNAWSDTVIAGFASEKLYVVETGTKVVQRCLLMTTDPGDLVLDPTCGSGTTAYVAEQLGRRWITIDTSRVSLTLARTRLMAGKFPYYLLADSPEGIRKEAELTGKTPPPHKTEGDIRKGFVYSRVPHVTLKSIANNPDIREGMTREEIDAAIARHAETETLFDKPYEDAKRLRVAGPFTVESLSPHRTISVEEKRELAEVGRGGQTIKKFGPDEFGRMILDNLKKAGVQNTVKNERLKFDSLEPFAGHWLHGEGRYAEADGTEKRAAICIGPEYGTVGPELVKEAAKEAVRGVGFDLLIVCGFAFDPHVSEETKRYGTLTVLAARMNPDLAMGDELLKKTGAGNLFMVFGEPDIEILELDDAGEPVKKKPNGRKPPSPRGRGSKIAVEIRGLDVYDPTTGAIRSSSTDDIACWFIDTDYDGESFFVRHAYFTGADEPYEKLKRALRAEIDEAAWSQLYSTRSRPFAVSETGKIAVKVINHYGDEVLKVYSVS
ncbi:MAG TPA: DNA methyltransferase [Pirellulales bacterium]|nr:DNA methyltransferase [Pirellulales bacterium]